MMSLMINSRKLLKRTSSIRRFGLLCCVSVFVIPLQVLGFSEQNPEPETNGNTTAQSLIEELLGRSLFELLKTEAVKEAYQDALIAEAEQLGVSPSDIERTRQSGDWNSLEIVVGILKNRDKQLNRGSHRSTTSSDGGTSAEREILGLISIGMYERAVSSGSTKDRNGVHRTTKTTAASETTDNSGTMIKSDPGEKFGMAPNVPTSSGSSTGTCESWMTITMEKEMEKACQEFVEDGYIRKKSDRDCIICDPDDWNGRSSKAGQSISVDQWALDGAKTCLSSSLKSGRNWSFYNPNNFGMSDYYQHGQFLCSKDKLAFYLTGKTMRYFSCQSKWTSCTHIPRKDGELQSPHKQGTYYGKKFEESHFITKSKPHLIARKYLN